MTKRTGPQHTVADGPFPDAGIGSVWDDWDQEAAEAITALDRALEHHGMQLLLLTEHRSRLQAMRAAVRSAPDALTAAREALADPGAPAPLRLVPTPQAAVTSRAEGDAGQGLAFKAGSLSAAIMELMADDGTRTAPWSADEIAGSLRDKPAVPRQRIAKLLEYIHRRGAVEKVPDPHDATRICYRVTQPAHTTSPHGEKTTTIAGTA